MSQSTIHVAHTKSKKVVKCPAIQLRNADSDLMITISDDTVTLKYMSGKHFTEKEKRDLADIFEQHAHLLSTKS
jgi:hypothetical protein